MSVEKFLSSSFKLIKERPKVLLPAMLRWIPLAMFVLLALDFVLKMQPALNVDFFQSFLTNPDALIMFFGSLISYIIISIPILVAVILIAIFIRCVYLDIGAQACTKNKINLGKSFDTAKKRMLPLLWTYILTFILVCSVALAIFIIGTFTTFLMGVGLILIFLMVLVFPVLFYQIAPVVVYEKKSGLAAIARGFRIGKKHFWNILLVLVLVLLAKMLIGSIFGLIPVFGTYIIILVDLVLDVWSMLIQSFVYFAYVKKRGAEK
jgi:hypothetical protein